MRMPGFRAEWIGWGTVAFFFVVAIFRPFWNLSPALEAYSWIFVAGVIGYATLKILSRQPWLLHASILAEATGLMTLSVVAAWMGWPYRHVAISGLAVVLAAVLVWKAGQSWTERRRLLSAQCLLILACNIALDLGEQNRRMPLFWTAFGTLLGVERLCLPALGRRQFIFYDPIFATGCCMALFGLSTLQADTPFLKSLINIARPLCGANMAWVAWAWARGFLNGTTTTTSL